MYNAKTKSYDVGVNITTAYSSLFKGNRNSLMEKQNPGLYKEVKAHEEAHQDQILEAVKTDISITANVGGKMRTYSGQVDEVITNAANDFTAYKQTELSEKIKNGDFKTQEEVDGFINNSQQEFGTRIVQKAFKAVEGNIKSMYPPGTSGPEADANKRASTELKGNMPYTTQKNNNF